MQILVVLYDHRIWFLQRLESNWSLCYRNCFLYWGYIRWYTTDATTLRMGCIRWVSLRHIWLYNRICSLSVRRFTSKYPTPLDFRRHLRHTCVCDRLIRRRARQMVCRVHVPGIYRPWRRWFGSVFHQITSTISNWRLPSSATRNRLEVSFALVNKF